MTAGEQPIVREWAQLSAGEEIEAWHNGRIFHRGSVIGMVPDLGLFWIMDARTGGRKLLDMAEFEIIRVAVAAISDGPEPEHTAT
ncbi:hypothetical protein ASG92_24390 [Arthrobacter sp. Soil736]|uniref:hypothetical protein n=1 Tax=Arthrobacter sp. Soil736 TaxID=1736395 RepID=UPI0006F56C21|nr:hypothetical protein [Arthrobacter sp. Soil736]KRE54852.1 hypothetical protein ASG92_24390 [Arthrobacter sp. Soil736]